MACRDLSPVIIWIDARPVLDQPFTFRLFQPATARDVVIQSGIPHEHVFFLCVNGQPWNGARRKFARGDVFTIRYSFSALFSIPLHCLEPRFSEVISLRLKPRSQTVSSFTLAAFLPYGLLISRNCKSFGEE